MRAKRKFGLLARDADGIGDATIVKPGMLAGAKLTPQFANKLGIDFDPNGFRYTLSSDRADRFDDIIEVNGWQLGDFVKAGGPLLLGHNPANLIGNVSALWKEVGKKEGKNRLRGVLSIDDSGDLGRDVLRMVKSGQLRGTSVGFRPLKWKFIDPDDFWSGVHFFEQELVEDSITPVPAQPDALIGKSMQYKHYMRAVEQEIDEGSGGDELERAFVIIKDSGPVVDTVGLDELLERQDGQDGQVEEILDTQKQILETQENILEAIEGLKTVPKKEQKDAESGVILHLVD